MEQDDVAARITALEQELASLKHEVAERPPATSSRRDVFKKLAIAGAGAAAGAVVLAKPAAALDTDPITAGETTTSQTQTVLFYDSATEPTGILKVFDDDIDIDNSNYPSAVNGWAYGRVHSGVFGYTTDDTGYGVVGWANSAASAGILAQGPGRANLHLLAEGDPGPERAVDHSLGEIVCDANGDVWLCVEEGNPGGWRQLGGPTSSGQLHLNGPIRVYDSRPGGNNDGPLAGGSTRVIDLHNPLVSPAVPEGATGAMVSLTLDATVSSGFLALFANDLPAWPGNSNVNWFQNGQILAVTTVTAVDADQKIKVLAGGPGSTQFIIDVIGYYA